MSRATKLVEKFLFRPESVEDIGEVRRLMEVFDYIEGKKSGSECIFHKKGANPINVPTVKGRRVKTRYVKRLKDILGLEEWYETNKDE